MGSNPTNDLNESNGDIIDLGNVEISSCGVMGYTRVKDSIYTPSFAQLAIFKEL